MLLAGCRPLSHSGPRILWQTACPQTISVACVRTAGRPERLLAVTPDGRTSWVTPQGTQPGPSVSGGAVRVLAADLDGDGTDELVVVTTADQASYRLAACAQDGAVRWTRALDSRPTVVLVADLTGNQRPQVIVGGSGREPLLVLAGDGAVAWQKSDLRQVVAATVQRNPSDGEAQLLVTTGDGLLNRYDALGQQLGRQSVSYQQERAALVPRHLAATPWGLCVSATDRADSSAPHSWALVDAAGRAVLAGDAGPTMPPGQVGLLAGGFGERGATVVAAADQRGLVRWLGERGLLAQGPGLGLEFRDMVAGPPDGTGRRPLVVATPWGLTAVGLGR